MSGAGGPLTPAPEPITGIGLDDLAVINQGALVLACGRGGGWERSVLYDVLAYAMRSGETLPVVRAADLPPDAWVVHVAMLGSPAILGEKLPDGTELARAARLVADRHGVRLAGVANVEIGGLNAFAAPLAALELGLPVVDGDLMGRASQHFNQIILSATGFPPGTVSFVDNQQNHIVLRTDDVAVVDRVGDAVAVAFGGWAAVSLYLLRARVLGVHGITGSLSRARMIGAALTPPLTGTVDDLIARIGGRRLFHGTITELSTSVRASEPWAVVIDDGDRLARIDAEQEYLVCAVDGEVVATVPDIICLLADTGELIDIEKLRLGLPVSVVRLRSDPKWEDARLAHLAGPEAFGLDLDPLLPP
ncbi:MULTISPECIES: DUF917 domain-containing protein [unclassified Amycolatopsis]|uniref:DUF917 domain-containing protein n=1 Tax=unclassified Amycolatopsis TaxID=2618356 RepID=UPI002E238187|nr:MULTISPECIES: DUF917 domain-containing protein [unclassified Amycolatopsis]